ncbi:MAG: hypothetical protein M5U07_12090 [Xanthobacteraceae bacterium]|nr:hypothetical protein [Xanthobacteraceae bacterium]
MLAAAVAFYRLVPRAPRPPDAMGHDRLAAIVLPDLLGFALGSVFLAMPVWLADRAGAIHPMAIMTWPLALGALAILAAAAHRASAWLRIEAEGLRLASARREQLVRYGAILAVEPLAARPSRVGARAGAVARRGRTVRRRGGGRARARHDRRAAPPRRRTFGRHSPGRLRGAVSLGAGRAEGAQRHFRFRSDDLRIQRLGVPHWHHALAGC